MFVFMYRKSVVVFLSAIDSIHKQYPKGLNSHLVMKHPFYNRKYNLCKLYDK